MTIRTFWNWSEKADDTRSEKQVLEEYLHTLEEAVRCRLRSRVRPIAIELSGGLDSSAVACLAARMDSGHELHTLSSVFDHIAEVDERERIQEVLARYSLIPHMVASDDLYGPQCFDPNWMPQSVLGPTDLLSVPAVDLLYDAALEAGCRVVLTGQMGDALNDGNQRVYFDLLRRGRLLPMLHWMQIDWSRSWKQALARPLLDGLMPLLPMPLLRAGIALNEFRQGAPGPALPDYFPRERQKAIITEDQAIRMYRASQSNIHCPAVRKTLQDVFPTVAPINEPAPRPLELRHPYMDRRLIELVLSMPQDMKWEHEYQGCLRAGRLHHRRALDGILPNTVRLGNIGVDFGPVIQHNLANMARRDWLMHASTVHIFERGYVLPERFLAAFNKPDDEYITTMLCVEAWLRAIAPGGMIRALFPPRARTLEVRERAQHTPHTMESLTTASAVCS